MIEVDELVKHYGTTRAVDGMSFTARPGVVTGFLGPNGAGKSTTMRAILGLDTPTSGTTRVDGREYRSSPAPLAHVGALLDGRAFDRSRTARAHLRAVGATVGVGRRRVDEVLDLAGLASVADKPAGQFSLGMGQRLGIATSLLADPPVIMLDEPVNGLDPDGITWIRTLSRQLADEGRTVLISSHLMSEMEMTADHLVIVGAGRVIAAEPMHDLIARTSGDAVQVTSPEAGRLADALGETEAEVEQSASDRFIVRGLTSAQVGTLARDLGVALHELIPQRMSLELVFMELTADSVAYHAHTTPSPPPGPTMGNRDA
jgi:ABC-2 type transport system ATP-binding protein